MEERHELKTDRENWAAKGENNLPHEWQRAWVVRTRAFEAVLQAEAHKERRYK